MIGTLMNHGCTCVLKEKGGSKKIPVHPEQYVYVQVSNAGKRLQGYDKIKQNT